MNAGSDTTPTMPSYSQDKLAGLLALLPGVDAVELKLTVSTPDQHGVIGDLGIDPLDAQVRQVAFFDTPDLRLSDAGVVIRARRTQHKPGDVTVKLRPLLPEEVPPSLRALPGFKTEVDASPTGYTCSCSLTSAVSDKKVKALLGGSRALSDVLDAPQLETVTSRLPEGVGLGDLRLLGPVHLLKCKFEPEGFPRRMVAELWFMPDGSRILELSTKAAPTEAFQAAAEAKVFLAGSGVDLTAPQEAKTQTTLAAFASSLEDG